MSVKKYEIFCKIDMFPLVVFSIHNFNLRNLKGNGNAATVAVTNQQAISSWTSTSVIN